MYIRSVFIIAGLILVSGGSVKKTQSAEDVQNAVDSLLAYYVEAINSSETDMIMLAYSKDDRLQWVEDGQVTYTSSAEIKQAFQGLFDLYPEVDLQFIDTKITPLGPGFALVTTKFNQSLGDSAGGGFSFGGAITMIVFKEKEGWKILNGHTSSSKQR